MIDDNPKSHATASQLALHGLERRAGAQAGCGMFPKKWKRTNEPTDRIMTDVGFFTGAGDGGWCQKNKRNFFVV